MKITKNKVASLSYMLEVEGKLADQADSTAPLEYIHGTGMLLPRFEQEVEGKEAGDLFAFTLSPEEGYGDYHPEYKIDIPLQAFEVEGKLRDDLLVAGNVIPMLNNAGQVVQGTVVEVGANAVTMDFNHPMAGKVLNFSGKVEAVRDATEKELIEGLHGEYLPAEGCGHCHGKCHKDGEGCHKDGEGCCEEGCDEGGCCHNK